MTSPSRSERLASFGKSAALLALIWLACFAAPADPGIDQDASWRMALGYAFAAHMQFGVDFVFNHGPLGFLMANTNDGRHLPVLIAWQAFIATVFTIVFAAVNRRLPAGGRFLFGAVLVLLVASDQEFVYQAAALVLGMVLLRTAAAGTAIAATSLFGLCFFFKFNLAAIAMATVGLAVIHHAWCGRRRQAVLIGGMFAAMVLVLWVGTRQPLLNLPRFLSNQLALASGYSEAMQIEESPYLFYLGLTAAALVLAYAALSTATHDDRRRAAFAALLLAIHTYLAWKHSFVRADTHMLGFFVHCLFVLAAYPFLFGDSLRLSFLKRGLLAAGGLASILGIQFTYPLMLPHIVSLANLRLLKSAEIALSPTSAVREYERRWRDLVAQQDLPGCRTIVRQETVDVLGYQQCVALLNGFNYHPRPVCQSYVAYSPRLSALNDWFYDANAPRFVLQRYQTIDERYPTLDDGGVILRLLLGYDLVQEEKGLLLWQQRERAGRLELPSPYLDRNVTMGETVAVAGEGRPVWAVLDIATSWRGRIESSLYKLPLLHITVTDRDGQRRSFRLVRGMAASGFLLSPLPANHAEFLRFVETGQATPIVAFSVDAAASDRAAFAHQMRVRLFALPDLVAAAR